jgi:hypothetical protein
MGHRMCIMAEGSHVIPPTWHNYIHPLEYFHPLFIRILTSLRKSISHVAQYSVHQTLGRGDAGSGNIILMGSSLITVTP